MFEYLHMIGDASGPQLKHVKLRLPMAADGQLSNLLTGVPASSSTSPPVHRKSAARSQLHPRNRRLTLYNGNTEQLQDPASREREMRHHWDSGRQGCGRWRPWEALAPPDRVRYTVRPHSCRTRGRCHRV